MGKNRIEIAGMLLPGWVFVYGASGEFDDSGKPAKNRAVSSAVAASKLLAGAAMSASMNAITTAANILGMATVLFSDRWHRRDTSADWPRTPSSNQFQA